MSVNCARRNKLKTTFVGAFFLAAALVGTAHSQQVCADRGSAEPPAVLADGGGNWIGGGGGTGP